MVAASEDTADTVDVAVARHAHSLLDAAPVSPAYRDAMAAALALPGNVLSATPTTGWARLVCTCCTAAGGRWHQAVPAAAAVAIFMVALDLLDDDEDEEDNALRAALGSARALNVATGLLLLAERCLRESAGGTRAAGTLFAAGLRACGGQHADLTLTSTQCQTLDEALTVTADKSASLVAAICQLGALSAGAELHAVRLFGRFGWHLGLVAQLANDIAAIRPVAHGKTDSLLGRPTLPLTYAALFGASTEPDTRTAPGTDLSGADCPAYLTWAVAATYRGRAVTLIPQLTADRASRTALAEMVDVLGARITPDGVDCERDE